MMFYFSIRFKTEIYWIQNHGEIAEICFMDSRIGIKLLIEVLVIIITIIII